MLNAIILAAGKGTRMKSDRLKVLHEVAGRPMVEYVLDAVRTLNIEQIYLVIGHQSEVLKERLRDAEKLTFVMQSTQQGTGHAVMQCTPYLKDIAGHTLVVCGDTPLITAETLQKLVNFHLESNAGATILTVNLEIPGNYGRIIRGPSGTITKIVEAKDATTEELKVKEINTGFYVFNNHELFAALEGIKTDNAQGEYYLTDVIEIIKNKHLVVEGYVTDNPDEVQGINTRANLAEANKVIYLRNNQRLMQEGVTIIDPASTFIDSQVQIGQDAVIYPFTVISGMTSIGKQCFVGPHVVLNNVTIEDAQCVEPFTNRSV